jgi:hypothetical protein
MLVAVDRIDNEEPAEEQQLGENKEPHAQFGAQIIAVQVLMRGGFRHLLRF